MVKRFLTFIGFVLFACTLHAQTATFIALDDNSNLFQVTVSPSGCNSVPLTFCKASMGSNNALSIALDGTTLYTVDDAGNLYKSTLGAANCSKIGTFTFTSASKNTIYGLTVDKNGLIYAASGGEISTFNPATSVIKHLPGKLPSSNTVGGDIIFYLGNLYVPTKSDDLIKVDLTNLSNSAVFLSFTSPRVFGISSVSVPCSNNQVYALSTPSGSGTTNIIPLNMASGTQGTTFCTLPFETYDAASIAESGAYIPPNLVTHDQSACSPSTVDLTTSAITSGSTSDLITFTYFTNAAATIPYSTPTTATTGSYYIIGSTSTSCADTAMVTVTINPKPATPVLNVVDNCGSSSVTATGYTGTLTWSDAGSGNPRTYNSTANNISVTQTIGSCISDASNNVSAAPMIIPATPVLGVVNSCGSTLVTATGYTGTLTWSDGGSGNPRTFVTAANNITVTQTIGLCTSAASNSVNAAPMTIPAAPVLAVVNSCGSSLVTASGFTGTLTWSDGGAGNPRTFVTTANNITVTQTIGSCTSAASNSVNAAPMTIPAAPILAVVNSCGSSSVTASGFTGTLAWSEGGTGNPRTFVAAANNITVTQTIGSCTSAASNSVNAAPMTIPTAPVLAVVNSCGSSLVTASGFTGTLTWSDGGSGNPRTYNTTTNNITVTQTIGSCTSTASNSVNAAPMTVPIAPTLAVVNSCTSSTITASNYTGTLIWSDGGSGNPRIFNTAANNITVTQTIGSCTSTASNIVNANPGSAPVTPVLTVINSCGNATITASGFTGTLTWSDGGSGNPRTFNTVANNITVIQTIGTCSSASSNSVNAAPMAIPTAPLLAVVNSCGSSSITASGYTGTLIWNDGGSGNPRTFNTITNNITVTQTIGFCTSAASISVNAAPITIPAAPLLAVVNSCGSSLVTATGFTGTLTWSDGGTGNPRTFTTATNNISVTQTIGTCTSVASNSVNAAPVSIPAAPTLSVVNNCASSIVTATNYTGTLTWSDGGSGNPRTFNTAANNISVIQTISTCTSAASNSVNTAPIPVPTAPTLSAVNSCGLSTITAANYTGTLTWSDGGSGNPRTLNTATNNITVTQTIGTCTSVASNSVNAAPIAIPAAPALSVVNNCASSVITATNYSGTLTWSDGGSGNPRTFNTTSNNITITQTISTCTSTASNSVNAIPNTIPPAPSLTAINNCGNSVITVSGFTGTLIWSDGGSGNPRTFNTSANNITVTQTIGSCTSAASNSVNAAPMTIPTAPVLTVVNSCGSSSVTASGFTGILTWSNGGSGNPRTFNTSANNITVTQTIGTCTSTASNIVNAVPNNIPSAPSLTVTNTCGNSVITASGLTGTLTWSDGGSGNPRTFTIAKNNITASQSIGTCTSTLSNSINAAPIAIPVAPILKVVNTCASSVITVSNYTGTLTWSDGGSGNPRTFNTATNNITVTQTIGSCTSIASNSVNAVPVVIPTAPTLTAVNNCASSIITATNYTGTLTWSDGGSGNPRTFNTAKNNITVTQTISSCTSTASNSVSAAPNIIPGAPVLAVVNSCGSSVITASGFTGTLTWSDGGSGNPRTFSTVKNNITVTQTIASCTSSASNSVNAAPIAKPAAPMTVGDTSCKAAIVSLSATGTGQIKWYTDVTLSSTIATGNNYKPFISQTTTYYATNSVGNCESNYTAATGIITNDRSESITDLYVCPKDMPYKWNNINYTQAGTYHITLTSSGGCDSIATLNLKVFINCNDIYFPSAFSPNRDGINDTFGPTGNLNAITNYTFTIYNRWGEAVFISNNPFEKWDGSVRGNNSAAFNFVWQATFLFNGQSKKFKGNVVLIK